MADYEWVQIVEPGTGRKLYTNVETGECVYKLSPNTPFKPANDDQWWELIDERSGKSYFYNAATKLTKWERPSSGEIVSMAKLQAAQKRASEMQEEQQRRMSRQSSMQSDPPSSPQVATAGSPANHQQPASSNNVNKDGRPAAQNAMQPAPASSAGVVPTISTTSTASTRDKLPPLTQQISLDDTLLSHRPSASADVAAVNKKRAVSVSTGTHMQQESSTDEPLSAGPSNATSIEDFKEQLNTHKRGLFRRKVSLHDMLSWSREMIPRPMLLNMPKEHRKAALDMFRLVQAYMGDRTIKGRSTTQVGQEIIAMCWAVNKLRDELFVQLCKQTTGNRHASSCEMGWQLMIVALNFFPPSHMFFQYLKGYIARHLDQGGAVGTLAEVAMKQLDKVSQSGQKRGTQAPTADEVAHAIEKITNPCVYGSSLEEIMELQQDRFPDLEIPLVVKVLAEAVLRLNGAQTEGIFRVPGDLDEVNALKVLMDRGEKAPKILDANVAASALKLWFRELTEPLIPANLYDACIQTSSDAQKSVALVDELPPLNRKIVLYITRFLQIIGKPVNHAATKMNYDNLSMVWGPNFLRCNSEDPMVIFNSTKREMTFVRQLILHLNTDEVADMFDADL